MTTQNPLMLKISQRKQIWLVLIATIGFAAFILSSITPPFMSPDESDHVKRAYGLLGGAIVLKAPLNQNSGVQIDTGLISYFDANYGVLMRNRTHKFSADEIASARNIRWSGNEIFSPAPGTGFYFPLLYAPQAIGLGVGKALDLTVEVSYRLARLFSLITVIILLVAALLLCDPPPLAVAFLMLPMTLFQLASASLDGISMAVAVLAISIFVRLCSRPSEENKGLLSTLGITLFLLISTRIYLLPMLTLPFVAYLLTKRKNLLLIGAMASIGVFTWLAIAITFTVDNRVPTGAPTSVIILYYLNNPMAYIQVLYATLSSPLYLYVHTTTFIGNLGWFDTQLPQATYHLFMVLLLLILFATLSWADLKRDTLMRLTLALCSITSVMLIFFALLVTWNVHPASTIQGIQGRYFLIPALLLAYSIAPVSGHPNVILRTLGFTLLTLLIVYSTHATLKTLINKYYIIESQTKNPPA